MAQQTPTPAPGAAPQSVPSVPGTAPIPTVPAQAPATPTNPPPPPATVPAQAPMSAPAAAPPPAAAPAQAAPATTGKKRILIVEDERPLAHALELKLNHSGYETVTAANGIDGLREAQSGNYDLMLLDLILPELDGFALLEELAKRKKKIPVVILSNLGQEEDKKRVEKYGVAKYCVKSNMPLAAIVNTIKVLTG